MNTSVALIIAIAAAIILGVVIFPIINKQQFKKMPVDQQIRILMKQANKLIYWKNISYGSKGSLVYIKNKRKIYVFNWILVDGKMLCTNKNLFDKWNYPEEQPAFTKEEIIQAIDELKKFNKKNPVKLFIPNYDDKT